MGGPLLSLLGCPTGAGAQGFLFVVSHLLGAEPSTCLPGGRTWLAWAWLAAGAQCLCGCVWLLLRPCGPLPSFQPLVCSVRENQETGVWLRPGAYPPEALFLIQQKY